MKKIHELESKLEKSIGEFRDQMVFDIETFNQNRDSEYLTKHDMEEIARQTFYALNDFKKHIVNYLKDTSNE